MQQRITYILAASAALLALVVVGGAVLLRADNGGGGSGGDAGGGSAQVSKAIGLPLNTAAQTSTAPTSVVAADGGQATATVPVSGLNSLPHDTAIALPEAPPQVNPDTTTPIPPPPIAPLPGASPAAATPHPPAAPTVIVQQLNAATPTNIPIPPGQPERVGGPVLVPNQHDGPRWVTLQVGHLRSNTFPDELAHLRNNTGAYAAGVSEISINQDVAQRTARYLIERGYNVDIIDAVVPVNYTTDFFLAIHADGNESTVARGFKAVTPWNAVPSTEKFIEFFYEEFGKATGLPADPVSSVNMANYYAFNPLDYRHAVNPLVPATLIEMGFVTNPTERRIMTTEADKLAWGITNAIDRWFRSGEAGPIPTPYPSFTPTFTPTPTPSHTPTETPTSTSTPTLTTTPTETATPVPTEEAEGATATAAVTTPSPTEPSIEPPTAIPTATPVLPRPTSTPIPTATPLQGIITQDGRWLPPMSPHVRYLPPPGSSAPPYFLGESTEDFVMTAEGRERIRTWQQFYHADLGRSIWKRGPDIPIRH